MTTKAAQNCFDNCFVATEKDLGSQLSSLPECHVIKKNAANDAVRRVFKKNK